MVSLRSSTRARASSSSARGSQNVKTNENAPQGRRALGDVKNVLVENPLVDNGGSRRKPLTDRNAPVQPPARETKKKPQAKTTRSRPYVAQKASASRSRRVPAHLSTNYELVGSSQADAVPAPHQASQAASNVPQTFSHVQVPSPPSELASLSAQIEEAARRAEESARTRDEYRRLSPGLSSDDLEYFDVTELQQTQAGRVVAAQAKRSRSPGSKDESSEPDAIASHGSSDKENVPPPTSGHEPVAGNRPSAHPRAGVLRTIEAEQPTHSTPISQNRKKTLDHAPRTGPYLDDLFLVGSESTSGEDSPGAARRAAPLTASAQQLLDHRSQGVSKVTAWKAAGHHAADLALDSDDLSNVGSWRVQDSAASAEQEERSQDEEQDDDFGFLRAERHLRERSTQALGERFSLEDAGSEPSERNAGDVFVDIPTDPFNTSDDRRLAQHIFGRMSSPEQAHSEPLSSAPPSSVVYLGDHKLQVSQQEPADSNAETQTAEQDSLLSKPRESVQVEPSQRRVTRSLAKRKADEPTMVDEGKRPSIPTRAPAAKSAQRAAKTTRTVSGIPLKRTEKKEQEVLEKLAADTSSSPSSASWASAPRTARTNKRNTATATANEMHMDDILHFLPPRKRAISRREASKGSKATSKTKPSATVTANKAKGKKRAETVQADKKQGARSEIREKWRSTLGSSSINSDDSERTKRLKEIRAAERYPLQVETVL